MRGSSTVALDPGTVLMALHERITAEVVEVSPAGCLEHVSPTGKVRWMGGVFTVKRVLYEHAHGAIPDGHILTRTCTTQRCVAASHHIAESRVEFGRWLGTHRHL